MAGALIAAVGVILLVIATTASALAAPVRTPHIVRHASVPAASCEFWTTDEGVSAVVVTSGSNCLNKPFTITASPYDGAVFTSFNDYLSQIGEFVAGPAKGPSLTGLTKVAAFNSDLTNHITTTVYSGPGNKNDGAAGAFSLLLGTGTPY